MKKLRRVDFPVTIKIIIKTNVSIEIIIKINVSIVIIDISNIRMRIKLDGPAPTLPSTEMVKGWFGSGL